jgi:hypothetical protein
MARETFTVNAKKNSYWSAAVTKWREESSNSDNQNWSKPAPFNQITKQLLLCITTTKTLQFYDKLAKLTAESCT